MAGTIEIVGVYPVDTAEPVHLVEVLVTDAFDDVDWDAFTQGAPETIVDDDGNEHVGSASNAHSAEPVEVLSDGRTRVAFFFHSLDLGQPVLSPFGPLQLPAVTNRPDRLDGVDYGPPF